jgi:chromosomal replication initiator protein
MLTAVETWSRLLERARLELPEQAVRTWLDVCEPVSVDDRTLTIGAPDEFAVEWNESKMAPVLAGAAPVALGHPLRVTFIVHESARNKPQMDLFAAPVEAPPPPKSSAPPANAAPLSERYTFEHFVVGKSNELAAAAANAVAQAPGKLYNPFFLYGDTGLGKTHLMQAVAHEMLQRDPNTRITFVGTEQFTNDLVAAIQSRSTHEFRRRYRGTDLLLVDDVQFLKGKEATQEEFFHTFNALYEAGRQIIITSDRPPAEIPGLEARLVSRFEWGMVADINLPDVEHRVAILRRKAQLDHLELTIPEDVIQFIADNVKSNVRELEGAIIKLLAYASLKHADITVDVAREALRDKLRDGAAGPSAAPTMAGIQQAVAREWGVTAEGLKSKTRTKQLTVPRQVAMFLSRELLGMQLVEIGNAFGGRDHSTVIHSLERVSEEMKGDVAFATRVEKLRRVLEGGG